MGSVEMLGGHFGLGVLKFMIDLGTRISFLRLFQGHIDPITLL